MSDSLVDLLFLSWFPTKNLKSFFRNRDIIGNYGLKNITLHDR